MSLFSDTGVRLETITPAKAAQMLKENPALLRAVGGSQRMAGDKDEHVLDKKGRPHTDTLANRMKSGRWRPYLSLLLILPNGGVIDGVTRLLACVQAGVPFSTLTYRNSSPDDFEMVDDPLQARSPKDILLNGNPDMPPVLADILGVVLRKAYVHNSGNPKSDGYSQVATEKWLGLYRRETAAFDAAANFVKRPRGSGKVLRKRIVVLMHYLYVGRRGAKNPERALELLNAYVTGISRDREEACARGLWELFLECPDLHERDQCIPAFTATLNALLSGKRAKTTASRINGRWISNTKVSPWPKSKKAIAGA